MGIITVPHHRVKTTKCVEDGLTHSLINQSAGLPFFGLSALTPLPPPFLTLRHRKALQASGSYSGCILESLGVLQNTDALAPSTLMAVLGYGLKVRIFKHSQVMLPCSWSWDHWTKPTRTTDSRLLFGMTALTVHQVGGPSFIWPKDRFPSLILSFLLP